MPFVSPFRNELIEFLNKYCLTDTGVLEDEETRQLLAKMVDTRIEGAELMTAMASEFERVASGHNEES